MKRVSYVAMPTYSTDWIISKEEYCQSSWGFSAADAAKIFDDKLVVIDSATGDIFLLGRKLGIERDGLEHRFLHALLKSPGSEYENHDLAHRHLKYRPNSHRADEAAHVNEVKRQVKERFKRTFADDAMKLEKVTAVFLDSPYGKVIGRLQHSDILLWGGSSE